MSNLRGPGQETYSDWQIEQGRKCGCKGTDEWCGCQNNMPRKKTDAEFWQELAQDAQGAPESARRRRGP